MKRGSENRHSKVNIATPEKLTVMSWWRSLTLYWVVYFFTVCENFRDWILENYKIIHGTAQVQSPGLFESRKNLDWNIVSGCYGILGYHNFSLQKPISYGKMGESKKQVATNVA